MFWMIRFNWHFAKHASTLRGDYLPNWLHDKAMDRLYGPERSVFRSMRPMDAAEVLFDELMGDIS